jgi:uncharacterized OsmC-like protein
MRIVLEGEAALTLSELDKPQLEVEHRPGVHVPFGAFEMFVVGLGLCTASVLASYGEQVGVSADGMSLQLRWGLAESPRRIGTLDLRFDWPELPESRRRAAELAAAHCPLHRTLEHPPEVTMKVIAGDAARHDEADESHPHHHPH